MLLDYKLYKRQDGDSPLRIIFQFSTITFILLWLYHLFTFVCPLSYRPAVLPFGTNFRRPRLVLELYAPLLSRSR